MSRADERRVSELLNQRLPVTFTGRKYRTAWGEADDHIFLTPQRLLILEVKRNQRHPGTNVLKSWLQLHRRRRLNIMLIHAFIEGGKAMNGSRKLLNDWIADRLEKEYRRRFAYYQLIVSDDFRSVKGTTELRESIRLFCSDPLLAKCSKSPSSFEFAGESVSCIIRDLDLTLPSRSKPARLKLANKRTPLYTSVTSLQALRKMLEIPEFARVGTCNERYKSLQVCRVWSELSHIRARDGLLSPNLLQLVSSISCCFAVHSGFFVLLINKISEALFVFPYLPVVVRKILPIGEMRRRDGFCACV